MATQYKLNRRLDVERSKTVIQALGGVMKVSRIFGIRHTAVVLWKKRGIPEARLQVLQLKFKKVPEVKNTLDFHPWTSRE